MITLKNEKWNQTLCENMECLRQSNLFCDVIIRALDKKCLEKNIISTSVISQQGDYNREIVSTTIEAEISPYDTSHSSQTDASIERDHLQTAFKAHSVVLAASSYILKEALDKTNVISNSCGMKEIYFEDISCSSWTLVLKFIYLGNVSIQADSLCKLQNVAKRLKLTDLESAISSVHSVSLSKEDKIKSMCDYFESKNNGHLKGRKVVMAQALPAGDTDTLDHCKNLAERIDIASNETTEQGDETGLVADLVFNSKDDRSNFSSSNGLAERNGESEEACTSVSGELDQQIERKAHGESLKEDFHSNSQDLSVEALQCPVCGKTFENRNSMKTHQLVVHPLTCDKCGKSFKRKQELAVHERVHTGEKPYTCSYCEKRFSQKQNMKAHEKTHMNEKTFTCQICGRTFLRKWSLQEHKKTHTGEKPFLCNICGKSFSKYSNLQVHERIHSGLKPYSCAFCGQTFNDPSTHKHHMIVHQDSKMHQCSTCGLQFARVKSLKQHERIHTGEKPYKCVDCNAAFSNTSNLCRHRKTHHKETKDSNQSPDTNRDNCPRSESEAEINLSLASKTPNLSDISFSMLRFDTSYSEYAEASTHMFTSQGKECLPLNTITTEAFISSQGIKGKNIPVHGHMSDQDNSGFPMGVKRITVTGGNIDVTKMTELMLNPSQPEYTESNSITGKTMIPCDILK